MLIYTPTYIHTHTHHIHAARGDLLVPRTRVKFGNRAFAVAGPEAWNSLPVDIRSSDTVTAFKNSLRHICLNCHTASSSDDLFDVDRRPCSDSRHVTAPYKSALYYYYYYYYHDKVIATSAPPSIIIFAYLQYAS